MNRPASPIAYVADPVAIHQTVYELIQMARHSIVIQMYLFAGDGQLSLVRERRGAFAHADCVADWLIDKRRRCPTVDIAVVLDSNTPDDPRQVRRPGVLVRHRLERAGIAVVTSNLFGNQFDRRRTFPPPRSFHRSWQSTSADKWVASQYRWQVLHNVEDHRKNLVIDQGTWAAVTSHNFIDAAADWHENLFLVGGDAARQVFAIAAESVQQALHLPQRLTARQRRALYRLVDRPAGPATAYAARPLPAVLHGFAPARRPLVRSRVFRHAPIEVLSSRDILLRLEHAIGRAGPGDRVALASAYFSERRVLAALAGATSRGARVQVLVDDIAGLPLGPIAGFLVKHLVNHQLIDELRARPVPGLEVRVHGSERGQLMHLKTLVVRGPKLATVIGGQANMTPNSFSGAWSETDIEVHDADVAEDVLAHFDALWHLPESQPLHPADLFDRPRGMARRGLLGLFEAAGIRP